MSSRYSSGSFTCKDSVVLFQVVYLMECVEVCVAVCVAVLQGVLQCVLQCVLQ